MDIIIKLPISIGEAIDKLTILNIKVDKIKDERRLEAEKEYKLLYNELKQYVVKYNNLYNSMYKVNLLIWDQMDMLRDGELDDQKYTELCRKCIETNDIRFRIKNKINLSTNSHLKEQKSYKINRYVININNDHDDIILFNIIQYLSLLYDEILVITNNNFYTFNDPTIKIINQELIDHKIKFIKYIEVKNIKDSALYNLFNIEKDDMNLIYDVKKSDL